MNQEIPDAMKLISDFTTKIISILDIIKPPSLDDFKEVYCKLSVILVQTYGSLIYYSRPRVYASRPTSDNKVSATLKRSLRSQYVVYYLQFYLELVPVPSTVFYISNITRRQVNA